MTNWPISGKTPRRHLDTTRANIEFAGAHAVDLVCAEGLDPASTAPFKGNLDIEKLERCIAEHGKEKIPSISRWWMNSGCRARIRAQKKKPNTMARIASLSTRWIKR